MDSLRNRSKRSALLTALMFAATTALGMFAATNAAAGTIKIFKSTDGKLVLICHYSDAGKLQYCEVTTPKN